MKTSEALQAASLALKEAATLATADEATIEQQKARIAELEKPTGGGGTPADPLAGLLLVAKEGQTVDFGTQTVDCTYGDQATKRLNTKKGLTGRVTFDNATFGDPAQTVVKKGWATKAGTIVTGGGTPTTPPVTPPGPTTPSGVGQGAQPAAPIIPALNAQHVITTTQEPAAADHNGATIVLKPGDYTLYRLTKAGAKVNRGYLTLDPAAKGKGQMFDVAAPDCTIEDIDFGDNNGELCILRNGADRFTMRRVRARTFARYLCYVEGPLKDVLLEDVTVEDRGADGLPDTADDDGGSRVESIFRGANKAANFTLRRCRFMYRGTPRKATVRGNSREAIIDDCYFDGGMGGFNPLGGGDGGRGWGLDRYLTKSIQAVSNPDEVRAAAFAAVALGKTNAIDIMRAGAAVAREWNDWNDHAKGEKKLDVPDWAIQQTADRRRLDLQNMTAKSIWTNTTLNFGLSIEAGCDATFDDKCVIRAVDWNNSAYAAISVQGFSYPSQASATDKLGWRLPSDKPEDIRPEPICRLNGTRVYAKVRASWAEDSAARQWIKGRFYFNDQLVTWA